MKDKLTAEEWLRNQDVQPIQDREDGKDYFRLQDLYTDSDVIEFCEYYHQAKLAESDLVSRKELLEWLKVEEHRNQTDANYWKDKSDIQESYNMGRLWACRDAITYLTQPKEGEGN